MLFRDKIDDKVALFKGVADRVVDLIFQNQVHPGDGLLVSENGFYDPDLEGNQLRLPPYQEQSDLKHLLEFSEPHLSPFLVVVTLS